MKQIALTRAGPVDAEAADYAATCLEGVLGVGIMPLDPFPDPSYSWDADRGQYSSTLVLRDAVKRVPPDAIKLVVLTEVDIFIPMLSFVYGQAQLDGPVAVLSFARLRQEFYGLPPNRALFLLRVRKEVLHETGHTFGLIHCDDVLCTMSLSTNIQQLDAKGSDFCEGCMILLRESIDSMEEAAALPHRSGGRT